MTNLTAKLNHYLEVDSVFRQTYDYVRQRLEAAPELTAHNFEHARRDVLNAIVIGEAEGADIHIVLCAAVLHDIGYLYGGTGRTHGEIGAGHLDEYLLDSGIDFPAAELEAIRICIRDHKGSVHDVVPETLEAKVVSDADMLEKLGPVGVYQFIRSLTEFNFDAEKVIERIAGADRRQLVTKTGNAMAAERRGFAEQFAHALDQAYAPYREVEEARHALGAQPRSTHIVAGAVVEQNGKYLLVQEKLPKAYGLWNLPAGRVDAGESFTEAAAREVREETGYEVEIGEEVNLEHTSANAPVLHAFAAKIAGGALHVPKDELLDVQWLSYDDIQQLHEQKKLRVDWVMRSIDSVHHKHKETTS